MEGPPNLRVLGGLALQVDGQPRAIGGPKTQQLLSVLLAHRAESVSADRIVDALWGVEPPRSATSTLQGQVSRLRALLPSGFTIALTPGGYRLDTPDDGVDALRFVSLVDECSQLSPEDSVPVLEAALGLWEGPAYGRYADLAEVQPEAVRLEELRLVATDRWAAAKLDSGDPAALIGELEALVVLHPLRESYWRLLMLALHRTGRQAEALRRAGEYRSMLRDELGLDVSSEVRDLESRIVAADPSLQRFEDPGRERRSAALLTPRLLGPTSFIGRDVDVASLSKAVEDHPVVTVTGPGGVGKTRLAMRVACAVMAEFDDGVTIVEFAPLRDPSRVAQVIAHALDIQQRQYRTVESTIEDHLGSTSRLLVLDNCEHVADAVAPIVDRLRASCPQLRILATSRIPLGIAGEFVEVLDPLSLPPADASTAEAVRAYASVELFVSRAVAATRGFELVDENAPAVAEICRRLDGLPLALELAAARLRSMGVEALALRLSQRAELMGQTQTGADGRRRTLHQLVEWSYDLLDPVEQRVFEQLAVFAGGFDLAAAESVCSADAAEMSTLGTLASLVEKSMVVFVDPGPPRYRLLEPLREFGLDRLRETGTLPEVEDRHLDWFVDLAERAAIQIDSPEEAACSAALNRDLANLRTAHLTAHRRGDADKALRLVASLYEFAIRHVVYEVESWAEAAADMEGALGHPDRPTAIAVAAYGRFVRGDQDAAITRALEALDGAESSSTGLAERVLGNAYFYLERIEEGIVWMDRNLTRARESGSTARLVHALYMRSVAETSLDGEIGGVVFADEARAAAEIVGSPTALAQADYAMGVALERSEPDEALRLLERASRVAAEGGNRWVEAFALTEVHWLRAMRGEPLSALVGYADVIDTWHRGGDWANQWLSLRRVLGILIEVGAFRAAAVLHGSLTAVGVATALPFVAGDVEQQNSKIARLRSLLGPEGFSDAVRLGASFSDGEIVGFVKQQIAALINDDSTGSSGRSTPPSSDPPSSEKRS